MEKEKNAMPKIKNGGYTVVENTQHYSRVLLAYPHGLVQTVDGQ